MSYTRTRIRAYVEYEGSRVLRESLGTRLHGSLGARRVCKKSAFDKRKKESRDAAPAGQSLLRGSRLIAGSEHHLAVRSIIRISLVSPLACEIGKARSDPSAWIFSDRPGPFPVCTRCLGIKARANRCRSRAGVVGER